MCISLSINMYLMYICVRFSEVRGASPRQCRAAAVSADAAARAGLSNPPWALMAKALTGISVNQRFGSMANPLNLLATLKWHKATYIFM